jgi:hypothetical protein
LLQDSRLLTGAGVHQDRVIPDRRNPDARHALVGLLEKLGQDIGIAVRNRSGKLHMVLVKASRKPSHLLASGVRSSISSMLPDISKFQVRLFSDKVSYLLGNEGLWLYFDPTVRRYR